jgi:glycosyltransferase involved in cell wall biosynthesis
VSSERAPRPLRIAVLGDFESIHTRRWLRVFIERGHDVHAISFYRPRAELPGVTLHILSGASASTARPETARAGLTARIRDALPPSLTRLAQAWRYRRAGLKQTLAAIEPDVFHAHYVVEHGFFGALAGFHPYVVSAWGSDLYVAPRNPLGRLVARYALRRADLVTANDPALRERAVTLGAAPDCAAVVRLGVDDAFLEEPFVSVNLEPHEAPPTVISVRALESLYNVDAVLHAFAQFQQSLPAAQLLVAGDGSERASLETLAGELGLGGAVRFVGLLDAAALRAALRSAHVYVSVPSSDSLAISTLEAMASGAFPVVSDLPSQDWIEDGVNGLRVPSGDVYTLARALGDAFSDEGRRRQAALANRARVASEGRNRTNMLQMEALYYRLVEVRPQGQA